MKINTISKKLIKPQTPYPQNLKNYTISFLDKQIGRLNFAVVLFYESKPEDYSRLEESLARILVQFYPLAGRYSKNDQLVHCRDQDVEFIVAEAPDVELIDLVAKNAETGQLDALLPDHDFRGDDTQLMSIKATEFSRGGLAIAIRVSHIIFDGASLGTFLAAWSNATNQDKKTLEVNPSFDLATALLSYKDLEPRFCFDQLITGHDEETVVKRLFFDKAALTRLRSKLKPNESGKMASRVCVVCAVIAKTLIGLDRAKHGRSRDFLLIQAVNMRERTIPPQSKYACGNFIITSFPRLAASETMDVGVQELANLMGSAAEKTIADHVDMLSPSGEGRGVIISTFDDILTQMSVPDTNVVLFSDWSKFGLYEADFGWGKPVWTYNVLEKIIVLNNNKEGDGIEAWLPLNRNDVHYLNEDEEIKLFMA